MLITLSRRRTGQLTGVVPLGALSLSFNMSNMEHIDLQVLLFTSGFIPSTS